MSDVINAVQGALGNLHFLFLYGIAIVLLLFLFKDRRKAFVIPCIIISIIVLNPAFYRVWNAINNYGYWRTLWMIPIIPACAAIPAILVEKKRKQWVNGLFVVATAIVYIFAGSYIYQNPLTSFAKSENAEKLPNDAVLIADALLELDDTPYVVSDSYICAFLRQYSGKIRSLYARDIFYGEPSKLARQVYEQLTSPDGDLQEVAQTMLNYQYEYLIAENANEERKNALSEAGFEFVRQVNNYSILRVTGNPTEIREYDELHRVTAEINVDENGDMINGSEGYAKRTYSYDQMGNVTRRFQTDVDGNAVLDESGRAGFERTYDRHGQIVKEVWLGADEKPVVADYAMKACAYNHEQKLVFEAYYDAAGAPMLRTDRLYAERKMSYDRNGNKTSERYYGLDGKPIIASYGYAGYIREYDGKNQLIKESYINVDDSPIAVAAGYCAFAREYDNNGNTSAEYYLDEKGDRVKCDKGYAYVGKEYDDNGRVVHEWYEDAQGNGSILSDGYAGFTCKYDDSGNMIEKRYLDEEGKEIPGSLGYGKVSWVYDNNNRLVRESYFNGENRFTLKYGYAEFIHSYDQKGNLIEERFLDADGKPVNTLWGYAYVRHLYDEMGNKKEDVFYDTEGNLAVIGAGYSKCQYIYTNGGELALVYYQDQQGKQVEAGSGFFHEYLQTLKGRDVSIFVVAKDDASEHITKTLVDDLRELGIQTDLRGQYRKSFYAVVTPDGTIEELSGEMLSYKGEYQDTAYSVISAGHNAGNDCSIMIDGKEYAKNVRGLNIVVFDNKEKHVVESIAFDTYAQDMRVTK